VVIKSIQVGLPRTYDIHDASRSWESGIFKAVVTGPVFLSDTNLEGDGQADLDHHGGPDRSILMYADGHYPFWEDRLGRPLEPGSFGENLLIEGADELTVCIGDVYESAGVTVEVSQPRLPCSKLARRLSTPGLNVEVMENRKGGWYVRTLRKGHVEAGDAFELISRPHLDWTVDRAFAAYIQKTDRAWLRELADLPPISQLWRDTIAERLAK
jgi:MOSC domain-containing protein YiiM